LIFEFVMQKFFQIMSTNIISNYLFMLIHILGTKKIDMAIENEIN
jgi:hypothetical protein